MEKRVAIVKDGVVENVITVLDDENYATLIAGVEEQFGATAIDVTDWSDDSHPLSSVSPGFRYDGTKFIGPEIAPTGITEEDMEAAEEMRRVDAERRAAEEAANPSANPSAGPGDNN